jgi:hypothetical protein
MERDRPQMATKSNALGFLCQVEPCLWQRLLGVVGGPALSPCASSKTRSSESRL